MNNEINRIQLATVDSTNNHARRLLDQGERLPDFTLITSEDQTAGRGQRGNSWETLPGKNIIFTLVCHPEWVRPAEQYIFSECIALAVVDALRSCLPEDKAKLMKVKWPNDIYYSDLKISGTLIECDLMGRSISNCIIGTGININQATFYSDAPNPVSLLQILNHETDREAVLDAVVRSFVSLYERVRQGETAYIHSTYKQNLYRNDGTYYEYADESGTFSAKVVDVEPNGRLILETEEGELRRYEFKEVRFIL